MRAQHLLPHPTPLPVLRIYIRGAIRTLSHARTGFGGCESVLFDLSLERRAGAAKRTRHRNTFVGFFRKFPLQSLKVVLCSNLHAVISVYIKRQLAG